MNAQHLSPNERLDFAACEPSARPAALVAHVASCADCRAASDELAWVDQTLAEWEVPEPPLDGLERVLHRVAELRPLQRQSEWLRAALSSLAGVACGSLLISLAAARFAALPWLAQLSAHAPLQGLAGLGLAALAFFALGSLVTLALTPILIMEAQSRTHASVVDLSRSAH